MGTRHANQLLGQRVTDWAEPQCCPLQNEFCHLISWLPPQREVWKTNEIMDLWFLCWAFKAPLGLHSSYGPLRPHWGPLSPPRPPLHCGPVTRTSLMFCPSRLLFLAAAPLRGLFPLLGRPCLTFSSTSLLTYKSHLSCILPQVAHTARLLLCDATARCAGPW